MDASQARIDSDLSDVTIVVDGTEFSLHKFPLHVKSKFFKQLFSFNQVDRINLDQFPGGSAVFSLIADYCYGKCITDHVRFDNVIQIRAACIYLELTDDNDDLFKHCNQLLIEDLLKLIQMSNSFQLLCTTILPAIDEIKNTAQFDESVRIVFGWLVHFWQRPLPNYQAFEEDKTDTAYFYEDSIFANRLLNLPDEWFLRLVEFVIREKCSVPGANKQLDSVTRLCADFINDYLCRSAMSIGSSSVDSSSTYSEQKNDVKKSRKTDTNTDGDKKGPQSDSASDDTFVLMNEEESDEIDKIEKDAKRNAKKHKNCMKSRRNTFPISSSQNLFDKILEILPNNAPLYNHITLLWLSRAVQLCDRSKSPAKPKLLHLCGPFIAKLKPQELEQLPNSFKQDFLHAIIVECNAKENETETIIIEKDGENNAGETLDKNAEKLNETLEWTLNNIVRQMMNSPETQSSTPDKEFIDAEEKKNVNFEDIFQLFNYIPSERLQNNLSQNDMFDMLHKIMEKHKLSNTTEITKEKQRAIFSKLDMAKCDETRIELALQKKYLKSRDLCKAAIKRLKLCTGNSEDIDNSANLIQIKASPDLSITSDRLEDNLKSRGVKSSRWKSKQRPIYGRYGVGTSSLDSKRAENRFKMSPLNLGLNDFNESEMREEIDKITRSYEIYYKM